MENDDPLLLDTSGWIAILDRSEVSHVWANQAWREVGKRGRVILLTDWIVAETGNGLSRGRFRGLFVESLRRFLANPQIRLIYVDDKILNRALELYEARTDKSWGLVDCASFVVMSDLGVREAFTLDHHFEQAGFRCLLK